MTDRQNQIIAAIREANNGVTSAQAIAHRLGYRPSRSGVLPVTSTLRALERAGKVGRIPPADQWSVAKWFLTREMKGLPE